MLKMQTGCSLLFADFTNGVTGFCEGADGLIGAGGLVGAGDFVAECLSSARKESSVYMHGYS